MLLGALFLFHQSFLGVAISRVALYGVGVATSGIGCN
jgi:hypothetical protein